MLGHKINLSKFNSIEITQSILSRQNVIKFRSYQKDIWENHNFMKIKYTFLNKQWVFKKKNTREIREYF
jgi:hypothetical protein